MIIDTNAFIGHYPFRQLRHNSAGQLVELMDRNGIDRALVTSLHAAFYRDAHRGNQELFEQTRRFESRLICSATINPKYVGWQRDLEQSLGEWRMKSVSLFPAHHGFGLNDSTARELLRRIEVAEVPVVFVQRLEDRRQRHHWDQAEDLEFDAVAEVAKNYANLKIIFCNWIGLDGKKLVDAGLKGRCLIDFSRLHVLLLKDVPRLIDTLGIEAISFGSHMPFDYVGPSLVKLSNLESIRSLDVEQIAWKNAARFLNLNG